MKKNILLMVSCVEPVVKINLKKSAVNDRCSETVSALRYYNEFHHSKFDEIHFIDCSPSSKYINEFKKEFINIKFYWYYPVWKGIDRGKGFSEYSLILAHYNAILAEKKFNGIVKVSARYRVSNINHFNKSYNNVFSTKSFFLKSSCSTVFYFHKEMIDITLTELSKTDENIGYYFEHALYNTKPQKRSLIYPKYLSGTISATTGYSYIGFKHFLRKIIYRFF